MENQLTKEDLKKFCSLTRDRVKTPYSIGDFTYATNGHLIVRIPKLDDVGPVPDPVDPSRIFSYKTDYNDSEMQLLPKEYHKTEKLICSSCRGHKIISLCDDCEGDGVVHFESELGHEYEFECIECNGYGVLSKNNLHFDKDKATECTTCGGEGETIKSFPVKIGQNNFQSDYINKLLTLPNLRFSSPDPEQDAVYFRFDGGDGFIMRYRA